MYILRLIRAPEQGRPQKAYNGTPTTRTLTPQGLSEGLSQRLKSKPLTLRLQLPSANTFNIQLEKTGHHAFCQRILQQQCIDAERPTFLRFLATASNGRCQQVQDMVDAYHRSGNNPNDDDYDSLRHHMAPRLIDAYSLTASCFLTTCFIRIKTVRHKAALV